MPFKPPPQSPDFSALFTSLNNSKLHTTNNALYQTIYFLINNTVQSTQLTAAEIEVVNDEISKIFASTIQTVNKEIITFPNSRQLLAGVGVKFDDSVEGERTINAGELIVREIPAGTVNGSNVTFTLAYTPIVNSEQVFLNGLLQDSRGMDYSISDADITFLSPPLTGDRILVTYRRT